MTTISTLEGMYDTDVLGRSLWQKTKGAVKTTARVVKKSPIGVTARVIQRPIIATAKFVAPAWKPVDSILKQTPIVRTAYRASIASSYLQTGQFTKAKKAYGRTFTSGVKDIIPTGKVLANNLIPGGSIMTDSLSRFAPLARGLNPFGKSNSVAQNFNMPDVSTEPQRFAKMAVKAQDSFADSVTNAIAQNATEGTQPQPESKSNLMLLAIPAVAVLAIVMMGRKK